MVSAPVCSSSEVVYESENYTVRYAHYADIPSIADLDRRVFGESFVLPNAYYKSWVDNFNPGFQVAVRSKGGAGRITGYSKSFLVAESYQPISFNADTNKGMCDNHYPDGKVLYGASLVSVGKGGEALFYSQGILAKQLELLEIHCFSRIPGFGKWLASRGRETPDQEVLDEYIALQTDAIQGAYERYGFICTQGLLEYLPEDQYSLGCCARGILRVCDITRV